MLPTSNRASCAASSRSAPKAAPGPLIGTSRPTLAGPVRIGRAGCGAATAPGAGAGVGCGAGDGMVSCRPAHPAASSRAIRPNLRRKRTRHLIGSGIQGDLEPERNIASAQEPRRGETHGKLAPGLYLVATPIGNLEDLTRRAERVLATADLVACEDRRVTSRLMGHLGLRRPLALYHEHNAEAARPELLGRLQAGESVALVSDAGTPAISDPGFKLVRAALDQGSDVYPVPGPSAVLAALIASGLPTDRFLFQGFLPPRSAARRRILAELAPVPATLVLFESPQRLAEMFDDAAAVLGLAPGRGRPRAHQAPRGAPPRHAGRSRRALRRRRPAQGRSRRGHRPAGGRCRCAGRRGGRPAAARRHSWPRSRGARPPMSPPPPAGAPTSSTGGRSRSRAIRHEPPAARARGASRRGRRGLAPAAARLPHPGAPLRHAGGRDRPGRPARRPSGVRRGQAAGTAWSTRWRPSCRYSRSGSPAPPAHSCSGGRSSPPAPSASTWWRWHPGACHATSPTSGASEAISSRARHGAGASWSRSARPRRRSRQA